jgi:LacI family transcriptional regulator
MKFESVTIKDIAKALKLSTSTVSRALRGSYEISNETKKMVLEYAQKLHYKPNPIALSLKEKKSRSIGVVVSEIANNFFSQAINGVESIAYDRGYHVIISQTHESNKREVVNVDHLASRGVDGLLVSLTNESKEIPHLIELHERGLPIVFFDRISTEIKTHTVIANNYWGAYHGTEHLIFEGFKKIAHITNSEVLSITKERLNGYRDVLEKHNIEFNKDLIKYCAHGGMIEQEVEDAVHHLFSAKVKPDAIFTASDRLTTICLKAIKKYQKKNFNLGIIGFTNTNDADLFTPSLTVVRQRAFEMGQVAIELLFQLIESKRPVTTFENKIVDTELIVRESSIKH